MLDLTRYANEFLPKEEADLFIKIFAKYQYSSVGGFVLQMNKIEDKLNWVDKPEFKTKLIQLCKKLSDSVQSTLPSFEDKMNLVLEKLDIIESFPEFEFKMGKAHAGICPNCGGKELFVPDHGNSKSIKCNRENKCGYSSDIYNYVKVYKDLKPFAALNELAARAGVDLKAYEASFEYHVNGEKKDYNIEKKQAEVVAKPIVYETFLNKEYKVVDFTKYIARYKDMNDEQKFKLIASYIYYFSKKTNQTPKAAYYKSRGISSVLEPKLTQKVSQIVDEIGYLSNSDINQLLKQLTSTFNVNDLITFGIINDSTHKQPFSFKHSSEEGFCVIPNFDLYSNMIHGLKLRNTKLASWQSKSMKEPELSYRRIANPLPYGLTMDAFINNMTFRMFEGQVDMFSLPPKNGYCDIAIPGVNGIQITQLGLFKDRNVEIWFDQDNAGQIGAVGAIKINIKGEFENDFKTQSLIDELKKVRKLDVLVETIDNKVVFKEIRIPNNESGTLVAQTVKTILSRRELTFNETIQTGLKQELEKAGAIVNVKEWNTALGSDVNEVLLNGNIAKI